VDLDILKVLFPEFFAIFVGHSLYAVGELLGEELVPFHQLEQRPPYRETAFRLDRALGEIL
jgi:hypothetical protein